MNVLLLVGNQLVRFGAFMAILYFVVVLYRERLEGAPPLLWGCIAVLFGEGFKVASFTGMGLGQLLGPALALESLGYCLAAFGFAKLVRATMKRQ